jgi:hypothetical protein
MRRRQHAEAPEIRTNQNWGEAIMNARALAMAALVLFLVPAASQAWVVYMDPEYTYTYNPLVGDFYTPVKSVLNTGFGPWQGYDQGGNYWADFYCLDLTTGMYGHGHDWSVYYTNAVPANVKAWGITDFGLAWASHLYNKYGVPLYNQNTVQDQMARAALQIAVWEAIYDGAPGYAWNLSSGNFRVLGLDNVSYFGYSDQGFVQSFVAPYLNDTAQDVATYWDDGQDLLGPNPVPEPTSLALLGLGLAGSGVALRKRQRR